VAVVEGEGEVQAIRPLITRVAALSHVGQYVDVPRPLLQGKHQLVRAGGIERSVELATRTLNGQPGGILILIDADDDCPVDLHTTLQQRARATRPDQRISVVIAQTEYETWFLASASSLAGYNGMKSDITDHPNPERVRGAKEWLAQHREPKGYAPTVDQAGFTARFDLDLAKRVRSFRKFCKEIEFLCNQDHE